MTQSNRRRPLRAQSPEGPLAVDPRAAPGSYLKTADGGFTRTDAAPGEPAATTVAIPAGSAQAMLDAFAGLGVEPPAHLVAAAAAEPVTGEDEDEDEDEATIAAPNPADPPPVDPDQKTEA